MPKEEKDKIKKYQRKKISTTDSVQKRSLTKSMSFIFTQCKTLKFDSIKVNKNELPKSKQPINLDLVNIDQIVISDKFKHVDNGFKCFIGYKEVEIVKPLCIILPQMSGYIKYFENGSKTCFS